nr:ABC-F family ATP-binding cassette domain-containing protein [Sphaerisporangium rufum]
MRGVSKSYGDRQVLDEVSFTIRPGERVGVVGENGSGKSTLLRLAAGLERPDDGEVTVVAAGGVGHLGQTLDLPLEHTVQQAIDRALAGLRAMERRMRELEAAMAAAGDGVAAAGLEEYGEILAGYELRGGWEADARVAKSLHGLGVGHLGRDRALGGLSGGERARLGLACLLAASPEVLLLDEPTNHLDAAGLAWLEDRLRAHTGTVVAVSHDRLFLDRVAGAILEVDGGGVTRFGGGYAGYLAEKAAARQRWEQAHQAWVEEVARVERFAATTAHRVAPGREMKDRNKPAYDRDAGRVQSSVASRVRQAEVRLRRLREHPVPQPPPPLRFAGRFDGGAAGGPLAELRDVRVGDRLAVTGFRVLPGERILVQGPNGAGKSTLLRVLAGELRPDRGEVRRCGRIGHLVQEGEYSRPGRPLLAAYAAGRAGTLEEHGERLLGTGLFRAADLAIPVGRLSVGQRRRLDLARLLAGEHDLLLLDEPANHLSLTLVEELEQALAAYPGAAVVVSHDRALAARFTGTRLQMRAGRLHRTHEGVPQPC